LSLSDYLQSVPPERRKKAIEEFDALPTPDGNLEDLFEQQARERSARLLYPNGVPDIVTGQESPQP
jgi:hypothetical protein